MYDTADNKNTPDCILKLGKDSLHTNILKNANNKKYGNVLKHLHERKGIRKDKFSKTVVDSINTLNTYKSTNKKIANKNQENKNQRGNENKNRDTQETLNNTDMKYTFSTIEGKCYTDDQ